MNNMLLENCHDYFMVVKGSIVGTTKNMKKKFGQDHDEDTDMNAKVDDSVVDGEDNTTIESLDDFHSNRGSVICVSLNNITE